MSRRFVPPLHPLPLPPPLPPRLAATDAAAAGPTAESIGDATTSLNGGAEGDKTEDDVVTFAAVSSGANGGGGAP